MVMKRLCPENGLLEKRVMNIFGFRDNRCVQAVKRKSELHFEARFTIVGS